MATMGRTCYSFALLIKLPVRSVRSKNSTVVVHLVLISSMLNPLGAVASRDRSVVPQIVWGEVTIWELAVHR